MCAVKQTRQLLVRQEHIPKMEEKVPHRNLNPCKVAKIIFEVLKQVVATSLSGQLRPGSNHITAIINKVGVEGIK